MYFASHPSFESLISLARTAGKNVVTVEKWLDEFLKGLSVLGIASFIIADLRGQLELVGSTRESAKGGAESLETILRNHDLLLGPQAGGFASLFRNCIEEKTVFFEDVIDFNELDSQLKSQLKPLGVVAQELSALDDIAEAFSISTGRVAICIVLDGISQWVSPSVLEQWLEESPHLDQVRQLFCLRAYLDELSVDFVQRSLPQTETREFVLWLLVRFLEERLAVEPIMRRLMDTLLKKAELGNLAMFEKIRVL